MVNPNLRHVYFLGIDPGINGGLAFLTRSGQGHSYRMPKSEADLWVLFQKFGPRVITGYIESQHAFPPDSKTAVATYMRHYGFLLGLATAAGLDLVEISPQAWKARFPTIVLGRSATKTEKKRASREKARQLFPAHTVTHYTAEALLIAETCRRDWVQMETEEAVKPGGGR